MEVTKISRADVEAERTKKVVKGRWRALIEQVKEDGEAVKVTGLSRGQVAAAYRAIKDDDDVDVFANYKDLYVVFAPSEVEAEQ